MDKDFNEFWDAYQPDENRFPRRRAATFRAWNERTPAARKAMLAKVKAEGAPKWKNPYFYVADFPEPEPTNYNGRESFATKPSSMITLHHVQTALRHMRHERWWLRSMASLTNEPIESSGGSMKKPKNAENTIFCKNSHLLWNT